MCMNDIYNARGEIFGFFISLNHLPKKITKDLSLLQLNFRRKKDETTSRNSKNKSKFSNKCIG